MIVKVLILLIVLAALASACAAIIAFALASGGTKSARRFRVAPVSEGSLREFIDKKASFSITSEVTFPDSPDQVWTALLSEEAYGWLPTVKGVRYAEGTQSVGARRAVLGTFVAFEEQIVVFDPCRRMVVSATGASLFGLSAAVQEFVVKPTAQGGTTLVWSVAGTPKFISFLPLRFANNIVAPFVRPFLKIVSKGFGRTG